MTLLSATGMPAAGIERATATIATGTGNSLAMRRLLWRRKKHLPQRKAGNNGEHQQKHSKMHPTGRVHSGALPRLERQFHSTERT